MTIFTFVFSKSIMEYNMTSRYFLTVLLLLTTAVSGTTKEQQAAPEHIYASLEYILSLPHAEGDLDPEKLSDLIEFVRTMPAESSMTLKELRGAEGAFHAFTIKGNISNILDYAYNPDIPAYVTMPSSLQHHEWLTPESNEEMRNLSRQATTDEHISLLRGREREIITPDTNTGGYYKYSQDRIVTVLPGPTGPVLISATTQNDSSDIGKKGCVAGDDKNWNYLYSNETGLNKTGLGWVDSYMYHADSVIVFVADSADQVIHAGSFKWLNGGWAKINMVKSNHILDGIKRFASDFKTVLESPGLPEVSVLVDKYRELQQVSEQELRQLVSPYLQALSESKVIDECSDPIEDEVASGEYLQQMSKLEMVRILLLEYVKGSIGNAPLLRVASKQAPPGTLTLRP